MDNPPSEPSSSPARFSMKDAMEAPVMKFLGMRLVKREPGKSIVAYDAQPEHANPMRTLHGGIISAVADAAMGIALVGTLKEGESFTTLEMKTNFMRPVWTGTLKFEGRIIDRGKTIALLECSTTDEKERIIAHSVSTCMVLRGDKAAGR
jgi:uncharacterized protein (TIGR00369 family)